MGIKGLLPLLKSIQKHCTLKKFSGQTIGVDAYGWLHRGVAGCAFALALDKPTTIHIDFVLSRVRMLLDFGVTPYLVFDGDNLPSKAGTNAARQKRREESKTLGLELHKAGKTTQAHQEFQKAVDVTPLMARQLIEELKKLNIQYLVAPYEADAQLVYLEQKGVINGILSEDSDLLVFGAKRLLTKLNQYGELVEVERPELALCKEISLAGWTDTMFRQMAILSGCDYLTNIGKIGLKTAHAYVRKYNDIEKIIRIIQFEGKLVVPNNYLHDFRIAELTFLHHRVFCPIAQEMVFLNELEPGMLESAMPYLGPHVDPDTAIGVACGDLDPFSKKPLRLDSMKSIVRPVLRERRPQIYASAAELKPKKSIETFFKPQRQPLAELDPNSLTPSPSQQQVLEHNHNASWEPRLVSSAPALRRSITTSVGSSHVTDRSTFLARASTMSTYQPPKRQRLCSRSMDPSPTREVEQSPFFASKCEDASPLAQKIPRGKKAKKHGFEVFSEAAQVTRVPQIQQVASPDKDSATKELPRLDTQEQPLDPDTQESIPQSSPIDGLSSSQSLISPLLKPSPSLRASDCNRRAAWANIKEVSQDEDPDEFADLLEYHVRKQNEALTKTFAFQPEERRVSAMHSLLLAGAQAPAKTFSAQSQEVQMAALKKLPKAGDIQAICKEIGLQKTFGHQSLEAQRSALRSLGRQRSNRRESHSSPEATTDNLPSTAPTAAWAKQEVRESIEVPIKHVRQDNMRGSEDAIVPNSEDECSEIGSPARKPQFDLSSFAFVSA